jgi:uncharacterized Tic20 family protein
MNYNPWPPAPGNPYPPPPHAHQHHAHQHRAHQRHAHYAYPPPPYGTHPTAAQAGAQGPSHDDRVVAALAYASPFMGAWIAGPIALYFWKRNASPFVRNHAAQAVFISLSAVGVWLVQIALRIGMDAAQTRGSAEWAALVSVGMLLGGLLCWAALLAATVVGAIKAYQGVSWSMPIVGRLSRWILGTSET